MTVSRKFLSVFLGAVLLSSVMNADRVYIRSDGPSDGDGRTWKTAFNSIDRAIANLQDNPEDNVFWVAAGVYSPIMPYSPSGVTGGAVGDQPSGLLTFDIPDGVEIYGGFRGCEKSLCERCQVPNPLFELDKRPPNSCDIPKDIANYALTVLDGTGSESWHVITIGNDIERTGANVKLFDLTIKGGYADGPDSGTLDSIFSITSLDYAHDAGGGLYARFGSNVDLYNVQFIDNSSSGKNASVLAKGMPIISGGGAIGAFDEGTTINVQNCYFRDNQATTFGVGGGAINSDFEASLNVFDSIFTGNVANRTGGAIRTKDAGDTLVSGSYFERNIANDLNNILDEAGGAIDVFQGNIAVEKSLFVNNEGLIGAGAIFFHTFLDDGDPYVMDVKHCLFEENTTGPFGGGAILIFGQGQHPGSNVQIHHSEFKGNKGGLGGAIYNSSFETVISHCKFVHNRADAWGGAVACDNLGVALLFPPLAFADRPVTSIDHCCFIGNKTRGVQPVPFGYPPFFTPPGFLNIFAELAPTLNGIPIVGTVDQEIVSGGGAIAVILAGVADISQCSFIKNKAKHGNGGAILVGGATGEIFDLESEESFDTFDYASAFVRCCKFKDNVPNNGKSIDLAGVGEGPDGITLKVKHCK